MRKETRSRSWKCRATSGEARNVAAEMERKMESTYKEMNEKEKEESGDDVEETS